MKKLRTGKSSFVQDAVTSGGVLRPHRLMRSCRWISDSSRLQSFSANLIVVGEMENCGMNGIADLSGERTRLRVTGADRAAFLQGQCTNDVKKLVAGQSCYAAFLKAKEKMRGEGHIICLPDAFLLETNPGLAPSLEKFIITEDVTIEDVSASMGEWLVVGDVEVRLTAEAVAFTHPLGTGVVSREPLRATLSGEALEILRVVAVLKKTS